MTISMITQRLHSSINKAGNDHAKSSTHTLGGKQDDNDDTNNDKTEQGEGNLPLKKRKRSHDEGDDGNDQPLTEVTSSSSSTNTTLTKPTSSLTFSTSSKNGGYFILPEDFEHLTDYYVLLFAQTKGGKMTQSEMQAKKRKSTVHSVGFPGMRCTHCGGNQRGSCFPSSVKNLGGCTPTLHSHFTTCSKTPASVARALKAAKSKHKSQAKSKAPGATGVFFTKLWKRMHDESFNGTSGPELQVVVDKLNAIVEKHQQNQSVAAGKRPRQPKRTSQQRQDVEAAAPTDAADNPITNVVSYEEDAYQPLDYRQPAPVLAWGSQQGETSAQTTNQDASLVVTEEDFEISLQLLRRMTPDNDTSVFDNAPDVNIDPVPVTNNQLATNTHQQQPSRTKQRKRGRPKTNKQELEVGKTRRFTREAEILLMKGMLKHGTRSWKKIYEEEPGLHHIKQTALKDRARTAHYKTKYERVQHDPSLLDRIDELCGAPDQRIYTDETQEIMHTPSPNVSSWYPELQTTPVDDCMMTTVQHAV